MNSRIVASLSAAILAAGILPAQGESITIPNNVLDAIGRVLPERSNAGAAFLAPGAASNLTITASCEIRVVFAWENAGYKNSLGWFSYEIGEGGVITVLDSDILFPNVERAPQGPLTSGMVAWLRDAGGAHKTFAPGDHVGFFIVSDGFATAQNRVQNWRASVGLPASDPNLNRGLGRGLYTSIPEVNPESTVASGASAGHVALVRMPGVAGFLGGDDLLLLGFEDLDRTVNSDDDFNDCVFLVDVNPHSAVDASAITLYDPNDRDNDGVAGINDSFPDDRARAWVRRAPYHGYTVLAFEDFYPQVGDGDYNDAVFAFAFTTITNSNNRITDLIADFHLVARGASYDHAFGLHLPNLPGQTNGTVLIERFDSGATVPQDVETRTVQDIVRAGNRVDGLFPSTVAALPRAVPDKPFANTWPGHPSVPAASVRVWFRFTNPVRESVLGAPPYDPFLFVTATDGTRADVHLPGFASFTDRSAGLPSERGSNAFLDANGAPFAILVPNDWRHPLESVKIDNAYPQFPTWRASSGREARTWYDSPSPEDDATAAALSALIPLRNWTLRGPGDRF